MTLSAITVWDLQTNDPNSGVSRFYPKGDKTPLYMLQNEVHDVFNSILSDPHQISITPNDSVLLITKQGEAAYAVVFEEGRVSDLTHLTGASGTVPVLPEECALILPLLVKEMGEEVIKDHLKREARLEHMLVSTTFPTRPYVGFLGSNPSKIKDLQHLCAQLANGSVSDHNSKFLLWSKIESTVELSLTQKAGLRKLQRRLITPIAKDAL